MRFQFDERKSKRLRANRKRSIGFEEAQKIFLHFYYLDERSDLPGQYRDWKGRRMPVHGNLRSARGRRREYYHLVTLWRATKMEQQLYEEHS